MIYIKEPSIFSEHQVHFSPYEDSPRIWIKDVLTQLIKKTERFMQDDDSSKIKQVLDGFYERHDIPETTSEKVNLLREIAKSKGEWVDISGKKGIANKLVEDGYVEIRTYRGNDLARMKPFLAGVYKTSMR